MNTTVFLTSQNRAACFVIFRPVQNAAIAAKSPKIFHIAPAFSRSSGEKAGVRAGVTSDLP